MYTHGIIYMTYLIWLQNWEFLGNMITPVFPPLLLVIYTLLFIIEEGIQAS